MPGLFCGRLQGIAGRDKTIIQSAAGQRHLLVTSGADSSFRQLTFQGNRGINAVGGGVVVAIGNLVLGRFVDVRFTANRVDPNDRYGAGGLHVFEGTVDLLG